MRTRQRKKLIDACISALHAYGPSRTTVDKVVSIAEMSPGIVNFYFETKAAMMVAALEFLSTEFEEKVLAPVIALKETPVKALELLIELYLDPELASPRKVSVWYAFWGEANSRQEYHDICGNKDESFAALVHDLIARLIAETGARHLDADGVALGLIGALEVLWQLIAFQDEADLDRRSYRNRCLAYLRSVFPGRFDGGRARRTPKLVAAPRSAAGDPLPGWAYADADLFATERDHLFVNTWQFVGHESQLPKTGDYLTFELLGERAFILRDDGEPRAFRNACLARPHALAQEPGGHFDGAIDCPVEGYRYSFDGRLQWAGAEAALQCYDLARIGGLIFIRFAAASDPPPGLSGLATNELELRVAPDQIDIAADWKVAMEQWLAQRANGRRFIHPNLLIDTGEDETVIRQVLPISPGRSRGRLFRFGAARMAGRSWTEDAPCLDDQSLVNDAAIAQSTQIGLTAPSYEPMAIVGQDMGDAGRFRAWLRAHLPALNEAEEH